MTRPSPRLALLAWLVLLAAVVMPGSSGPSKLQRREHPAALPLPPPAFDIRQAVPILEVDDSVALQPIPVAPPVQTLLPEPSDPAPVRVTSFKRIADCQTPVAETQLFNHAPDYSWLVGRLEYVYVRNTWKLHYAGAAEADRHGGSVTLVGAGPPAGSLRGRLVRVEGRLVEADGTDPCPAYEVHFLQLLSLP
jgi:hypothetical protein